MPQPRFIPAGTSVSQFLAAMNAAGIRYVVVRWFENLPKVTDGEDIDIFVHKADIKRVRAMLRYKSVAQRFFGATRVKIDLKNAKRDFLPGYLSDRILRRAVMHSSGAKVPCKEDYFYSLAYRTVRHKDGLNAKSPRGITYGAKLRELADALALNVDITLPDLAAELQRDASRASDPQLACQ